MEGWGHVNRLAQCQLLVSQSVFASVQEKPNCGSTLSSRIRRLRRHSELDALYGNLSSMTYRSNARDATPANVKLLTQALAGIIMHRVLSTRGLDKAGEDLP